MRVFLAMEGHGPPPGTRNATKSVSSLKFPFNVHRLRNGMLQNIPGGSRKWAQPEWSVPKEYSDDGVMSVSWSDRLPPH